MQIPTVKCKKSQMRNSMLALMLNQHYKTETWKKPNIVKQSHIRHVEEIKDCNTESHIRHVEEIKDCNTESRIRHVEEIKQVIFDTWKKSKIATQKVTYDTWEKSNMSHATCGID